MQSKVANQKDYLKIDAVKGKFLVNRKALMDPAILELEREKIFSKCWLFIGHESEVKSPGSFITRRVGGRSLIFIRGSDNIIRAFHNTCPHRGALVCREKEGKTKVFRCFYHAWTFSNNGKLAGRPGGEVGYPDDHNCDGSNDLKEVARLESYKGFVFINFDENAISLEEYLADAKEYIDLVADQSEVGMEVIGKSQEYSARANWKLMAENSVDGYHGMPTHKTYFDYVSSRGGVVKDYTAGPPVDLGNGHNAILTNSVWGRPVARWIPAWGEEGKAEIDEIYKKLVNRVGEERAKKMADLDRNMVIFPNLVINDIMAITIRTFDPVSPDFMELRALALGPKDESPKYRRRRLDNFLEFLGPGGFATPDDVEALELVQEAITTNPEVKWNDISKGMLRDNPDGNDEEQMRIFWRQWNKLMTE